MWVENSVFYHIYPLGLCGAPLSNDFFSEPVNRLSKLATWIPHLCDLGCNAVYLGPVFESGSHGYDTADYFTVDRRLGTKDDLKELINAFHQAGIKVILDAVFNHVGRHFWAFEEVRREGKASPYCSWFKLNFDYDNSFHDGFCYYAWDGCDDLVKLNQRNPEVRRHIFEAVTMWVKEFDIDGLRLDVAHYLRKPFLRELRQHCNHLKSDFWLMGEVLFGNYNRQMNPQMLNSVTNYEAYKGLHSSCTNHNMFEIAYSLNRQFNETDGLYRNSFLYNFLENHDVSRIATILNNPAQLKPLYTLLFTLPGIPSLYYGGEWGLSGCRDNSDTEVRPTLELQQDTELTAHLKYLIAYRKNSQILTYGTYLEVAVRNNLLAFTRNLPQGALLIAINIGTDCEEFDFNGCRYSLPPYASEIYTL